MTTMTTSEKIKAYINTPTKTIKKITTYLKYEKDMKTFKYEQDFIIDAEATITGFEKMSLMYDKAPEKPTDEELEKHLEYITLLKKNIKKNEIELKKLEEKPKKKGETIMVKCECGAFIRKDGLHRHKKTAKHAKGLEQK